MANLASLLCLFALYSKDARHRNARHIAPPNTLFETDEERSALLSWATVFIFFFATLAAIGLFGSRYAKSVIHDWETPKAIGQGFFGSRREAFAVGCKKPPCFAMAQRKYQKNEQLEQLNGVFEYNLLWTDELLLFIVLLDFASAAFLIKVLVRARPAALVPVTDY